LPRNRNGKMDYTSDGAKFVSLMRSQMKTVYARTSLLVPPAFSRT
jgi:hypothetical protein